MKLLRFGESGAEKPGIELEYGRRLDVSAFTPDFDEAFFREDGIEGLRKWLITQGDHCPPVDRTERLGPPVARPSKLICVGLNYAQHARESGMQLPPEPVLFFKATTAICGPFDDVIIPKNSFKTDWEVELAVVIGKKATYVEEAVAMNHVAGYLVHNDISERAFQLERAGQWVKGKSADTFAPLGPFLVTKDEAPDPGNLPLWLRLNGQLMQNSNTSDLVFKVPFLVSYISQFMTLLPGDIISTGTPFGVGMGLNPQRYLQPGDIMELSVEGMGVARQRVVGYVDSLIR